MNAEQLTIENIAQILHKQQFPTSVEAALMTIRACEIFSRSDLSLLANQFIFGLVQSTSTTTTSQNLCIKRMNNLQELQTLNILRQFLENETDLKISTRVFDIIFVDILNDQNNPLFSIYYDLVFKFLSLALSFESKQTLTIISRWLLDISISNSRLVNNLIEQIIHQHIALTMSSSITTFATISPLFTLCFMTVASMAFENKQFQIDVNTVESLIRLFTDSLDHSTNILLQTLQQELSNKERSILFEFMPSIVQLNLLILLRSFESANISICFDRFHTSILSFLFSIVMDASQKINENCRFEKNLFPADYFQKMAIKIRNLINDEQPNSKSIEQCIVRYLQIVSICRSSSFPLSNFNIDELTELNPFMAHHKLFEILKHKEKNHLTKE